MLTEFCHRSGDSNIQRRNNMKVAIIGLIFCVFMGITAISMGFGAFFPSINLVSKPFVCPGGSMDSDAQMFRPYPGKNVLTRTWYCTDATGTKTQLGLFQVSFFAGVIHGLILFVFIFLLRLVFGRRRSA